MTGSLHIMISAEPIFSIGSLVITNSILTSLVVSAVIIAFAFATRANLSSDLGRPTKLQNFAEFLIEGFYGLIHGVTNDHKRTRRFMPLIMAFFVFIALNNWMGLVPGVGTIGLTHEEGKTEVSLLPETITLPVIAQAQASTAAALTHVEEKVAAVKDASHAATTNEELLGTKSAVGESGTTEEHAGEESGEDKHHASFVPLFRAGTADLNTTVALALITMSSVQFWGIKYLGLGYFKKFFDFSSQMNFFVGILELVSDISKVLSFAFRLFGNIFAGEVLLIVIGALVPLGIPMVFYGLEIFVGGMQALVFSLLSLVFYYMATVGHEEH